MCSATHKAEDVSAAPLCKVNEALLQSILPQKNIYSDANFQYHFYLTESFIHKITFHLHK